ncbi:MAG: tetratricopeptide repeat protein, partial [Candidatus Promineifilaceae bacterium]|nr:tetratricopeptide repeat protein [Candidatus Promineifilaceae bacterium]
ATGRPAQALQLYEEALPIMREVGDRAGEAATLSNLATLMQQEGRGPAAVARIKEAIALFRSGLTHDATGRTVEPYEELLAELQAGETPQ